jgi:hypothetical protein
VLALRLTRVAHPAVQLRRLTVAAASAGTGFLLLCSLGYALGHPDDPAAAVLRLSWCAVPFVTTVYLAVAVARTDPGTRLRPGLSALGLGPARLMAVSAATTALSCAVGSLLALVLFLHLRGDLTGLPFDGAASVFLARGRRLPVPGTITLLLLVPAVASVAAALTLRPREAKPARGGLRRRDRSGAGLTDGHTRPLAAAGHRAAGAAPVPREGGSTPAPGRTAQPAPAGADGASPELGDRPVVPSGPEDAYDDPDPHRPPAPRKPPAGLPWGFAVLAAGLTVEAYSSRATSLATPAAALPGGLAADSAPVLVGWLLTALGLALAGPGLTHLCGRLLQAVRPGALRLLAGRVLMEEAARIGHPLGVVCAVASGVYAMVVLYDGSAPAFGPLTALGTLLVAGCTVATLLTAAVEARQDRAGTTAALLRLGAPATVLRVAAVLRAGALLVLFAPLTLVIADLAALPLAR